VSRDNQKIGMRLPRSYLDEYRTAGRARFKQTMNSHLIPCGDDSGIWDRGVVGPSRRFVRKRLSAICSQFERLQVSDCFERDERRRTNVKRKLIEVALPLEAINLASAREKSIRHGHPSTLHLWWARRPLAAARAVIFAQMVDDPSAHPTFFPLKEAGEGTSAAVPKSSRTS